MDLREQLRLLMAGPEQPKRPEPSPYDVPLPKVRDDADLAGAIQGAWDMHGQAVKDLVPPVGDWAREWWEGTKKTGSDVAHALRNYSPHQAGQDVLGALDMGATTAQNIAASAPAGYAGLAGAAVDAVQGNDDLPTAQRWQGAVQEKLGNQPLTPEGREGMSSLGKALRETTEGPGNTLANMGVPPWLVLPVDMLATLEGPPGLGEVKAGMGAGVRAGERAGLEMGLRRNIIEQAAGDPAKLAEGAEWARSNGFDSVADSIGTPPPEPGTSATVTDLAGVRPLTPPERNARTIEEHKTRVDAKRLAKSMVSEGKDIEQVRQGLYSAGFDLPTINRVLEGRLEELGKGPDLRTVGPPPNDFTPKGEKSAALRSQEGYLEALKDIKPGDAADLTNAGPWLQPDPVNGGILGAPPGFAGEKHLPKLDARIAYLADLGKKGAPWYWNTRSILTRMTDSPEASGKLAGVQAAVSPQVSVARANDLAMNYMNRRKALGPEGPQKTLDSWPGLKETVRSADRVMEGGDPGGPKRDSFAINMRPNSPPQARITVDAHMMDGYGYKTKAPSDPQYTFVTGHQNHLFDQLKNGPLKEKYPELAAALREPMDLQAATWVGVRIEKALKGRKWESLSPREQRAIQLKAQEDYESLADNTRMHVVHEDAPATAAQDRGHATGFNELSNEKKRAYQQLVNPDRDPIASSVGLVAEPRKDATGTWTDEGGTHENPLNVTAVHGGTGKGTLATDPHSQDAAQLVALMHGYPKAQAMVPVSRVVTDLSEAKSGTANALRAFEGPGAADDVKNALELKIKEHNEALPQPLWPNHELTLEQTGDGSYTVSGNWGQASAKEFAEHGSPIAEALRKPKVEAPVAPVEDRFGTGNTKEVFRMPPSEDVNIRPGRRESLPGSELDWSKLTPEGSGEVTDQWVDQLKPIKARSPGLFSEAEKNWSPTAKYLRTLNEVENSPFGAFPKAHPAMTKAREVLAQMGPKRFVEWWDGLSPEAKKGAGLPVVALAGAELLKQLNQGENSGGN